MRRLAAASLVALAVLPGCSGAPADPVAALLAELEAAAEARDAERFASRLAADFAAAGGLDRAGALAELKRYLAAYEKVAVEVYGVETEGARVRCTVEFSGNARKVLGLEGLLPPSAAYLFELEVADEGGVLRVRRAAWTPAEPEES